MTRTVHIWEIPSGWTTSEGRDYETAAEALAAVKRSDRRSAKRRAVVVTEIVWHPSTGLGATIVRALAT